MNFKNYSLFIITVCIMLMALQTKAQSYLGITNSNYSGVNGILNQPAAVADSRYKFDIMLFGVSAAAGNNYIGIEPDKLFNLNPNLDLEAQTLVLRDLNADEKVKAAISTQVDVLSFLVSFGKKSNGIGFTLGARNYINIDEMPQGMARIGFASLINRDAPNVTEDGAGLSIDNLSWVEYGLTYGQELYNKDKNFLKGGLRVKLVNGITSVYTYANRLDYEYINDSILHVMNADINYGHGQNIDNLEFDTINGNTFKAFEGISPAFDIGFVYEYRPDIDEFRRKRPDGEYEYEKFSNKYKFKFGFSVLDIGKLTFDRGNNTGAFTVTDDTFTVNIFDPTSIQNFDDTINTQFDPIGGDESTYTVSLPTALSLQFDYHLAKGFYVNLNPFIALNTTRDPEQSRVRQVTTYSLTPRWESKWIDVALPFSYNEFKNFNVGLGLRLGPVIVGSNDLLGLIKNEVYGTDAYLAIKIPIPYGKAKDTDEDGIPDVTDRCPDQPGLPELNGCPDTDKDGIADLDDKCPLVAGIAKFTGCPDTDNDDVQDSEDACPTVAGSLQHNGCPDTDGDGLFDNEDDCPTERGPADNKGCPYPDKDKDGVRDTDDKCPDVPGPISNNGCPVTDKDGDGIPDKDDKCPNTPGIPELNGCPKLEEKEEQILKVAFDNLEFETAKDIIRTSSYPSLNDLANLLVTKPSYGLRIAGHTDNVGTDEYNMELSHKRADAVKNYLMSKGVPASKLVVEYYGESRPIADNKTKEGKQKNRRVEMTVIFE